MSLTDDAINRIKQMILDGRLKAGDRLPREADLADELGISRSSLREAVRALALVRILDVRQGDGTYVTSLSPDVLMESIAFLVDFHQDASVLHLFGVRRVLEPAASEIAASVMSNQDAESLVAFVDSVGSAPSVEDLVRNDVEFHHRIAAATGNPMLCSLIDSLSGPTQRARIWRGMTQTDARERTLAEHRCIATAIRARQPSLARAWATVHVAGVEEWLRQAAAT